MLIECQRIFCVAVASVLFLAGLLFGSGDDTDERYVQTIAGITVYENTMEEAVPQTRVYDYIRDFFNAPLAEDKTEKKAIVIGYDGCRADMLQYLNDSHESAINALLAEDNSCCFLTYSGGANYPLVNTQATSTSPSWCSMLTGVSAQKHGATANYIVKSCQYRTLLTTLVEDSTVDSSAFYVSWDGHIATPFSTYYEEMNYCKSNNLNVIFTDAEDDAGTQRNVISDLQRADCSDFIFTTLEAPDHAGHDKVFSAYNEYYIQGFYDAEKIGLNILSAVKNRPTYDTEDWLIIITTDHGGRARIHGFTSIMERMTFLVSNRELL